MNARVFKTKLGWAGIASDDDGITDVLLPSRNKASVVAKVEKITGERYRPSKALVRLEADLKRYFRGEEVDFGRHLVNPGNQTLFRRYIWAATRKIPRGSTATYGRVAEMAGFRGAARAAGGALNANPVPILVPCHRVVSPKGLGGFAGGPVLKKKLLQLEGAKQ